MSLDIILGPMFAGKSSAIIGMIRRNNFISRNTLCVTSTLDRRYSEQAKIITHDKDSYPAVAVETLQELRLMSCYHNAQCVIIEEAQFFPDLRDFVLFSVEVMKKQVVCVGLDGDAQRKPFGQLLELIPYADSVDKYKALCPICYDGTKAIFTSRKIIDPAVGQISVGGADQYEPLCRKHYLEHNSQ
jgi:thymidine kinase